MQSLECKRVNIKGNISKMFTTNERFHERERKRRILATQLFSQ